MQRVELMGGQYWFAAVAAGFDSPLLAIGSVLFLLWLEHDLGVVTTKRHHLFTHVYRMVEVQLSVEGCARYPCGVTC